MAQVLLAPSPAGETYDLMYYLKGAAAGGICCSITHGTWLWSRLCATNLFFNELGVSPL